MSVVSAQARRRWSVVVCGIALLCVLPAIIAALPVPALAISAATLRARILASASVPYQGYADSTVDLGLPELPDFHDVSTLLDGTTDQYAWYSSPGSWRASVVTDTGENDIYQVGPWTYLWDYGHNVLTRIVGAQPVRLPQASDLLPPALARRLLTAASPADHVSRLPSRRVAGMDAAGLRLVPADPATTVAAIDIWADPADGLPVEVEITGRGSAKPILVSSFLQLTERQPAYATLVPEPAPGVIVTTAQLPDVDRVLNASGPRLPWNLAGLWRDWIRGGLRSVGVYGTGLSRFIVLPLPGNLGTSALNDATQAGAGTIGLPGGTGVVIRTPLLTVLLVRPDSRGPTFLLTGAVTPDLLKQAGADLLTRLAARR